MCPGCGTRGLKSPHMKGRCAKALPGTLIHIFWDCFSMCMQKSESCARLKTERVDRYES